MANIVTIPDRATIYEIDIDIHEKTSLPPIYSKQYEDGSRFIKATLWDNGMLYPILNTDTIYFVGTKKGNKGILISTEDASDYLFGIDSNGNVIYQIRPNDTATDSSYEAEFRIYDINKRTKATPTFKMFINKSALQDETPVVVDKGSLVVNLVDLTNGAKTVVDDFYKVAADKFGINDAMISTITAWSSNRINDLYSNLYNRMGLMPVDGGTFFEEYIDWTADAGTF